MERDGQLRAGYEDANPRSRRKILSLLVDAGTLDSSASRIVAWASENRGRYVCIASVHMAMEVFDDENYAEIVNTADLVTSDGMPLVFGLRRLGCPDAERVAGPDLMPILCDRAEKEGIAIGLYGSTESTIRKLVNNLHAEFPRLDISYAHSPPFRKLTGEEIQADFDNIRTSGARLLFVGLGCPKQERWMNAARDELGCVMLGVGAAFDFQAGVQKRAPLWMQKSGLEWLFRLLSEPRRLWRRYLVQNTRFVYHFGGQLVRARH